MTGADLGRRFTGFVAGTETGETIQLLARRSCSAVVVSRPGGGTAVQRHDHWQLEVQSARDAVYGVAMTTDPGTASLAAALEAAREFRRIAPLLQPEPAPLPALSLAADPGQSASSAASLPPVRDVLVKTVDAVHDPDAVTVTVTDTVSAVWLGDSTGRRGSYLHGEAQLHLRSRHEGAQGAALACRPADLDPPDAIAELERSRERLAAGGTRLTSPDWVLCAPLATAQLLSHITTGLLRTGETGPSGDQPVGSAAVTLIDDGTLPGGPASIPFDDDGIPTRRTEIIGDGRLRTLLSGLPLSVTTGNARRRGTQLGATVAPTNLFLMPTRPTAIDPATLGGNGLHIDQLSGVRYSTLDLRRSPVRLTARGAAIVEGKPRGRTTAVIDGVAQDLLTAVSAVAGTPRFYRVNGVMGGSACLLEGLKIRIG